MQVKRLAKLKSYPSIYLLALASSHIVSASVAGSNASNSNQNAIDHINQAQSALQNGDTEGA